jgi:hypothetical protein
MRPGAATFRAGRRSDSMSETATVSTDELQKEIDRLKAENQKLTKDLAGAHDDLREVRGEARDRRHETKTLKEQLEALVKERDEFRTKAEADPDGLRMSLAEHQATIRGLKHEAAYGRVATGLKVNDPTRFADLVKLANYQPEGDEPDETKIAAAFTEALKGRPWLVDAPPVEPAKPAPGGAQGANGTQSGGKPGPGAERGQSVSSDRSSQARERIHGRL